MVLRAFSIELALKALYVKRGIDYPRTHDLLELFGSVQSDDRAAAVNGYEQKEPNTDGGLEGLLKRNANAFEEWRYHHENARETIEYEALAIAFDEIYTLLK